jgi:hypothetical protein
MVILGATAAVFERNPVTATDFAVNQTALLTQSMLILAGAAFSLWFIGSLRTHLLRAEQEQGAGRLSSVAFGAGIAWAALNMLAQAFQLGAAGGWLNFVLYPFFLIWLLPATVVMVMRAGQPAVSISQE